ncbi:ECF transporter S component [Clostridiaceae bacterium NSJ-31]|uniref:ECF transporter S component n=1 Tax=Ligaoa zhengdingensis TaxID=2763658 RepID=A0A926DXA6_9FIRM|nr:ECF transporter S component [Ligaoa zhengdingensis]MBC8547118.1 ECF transporter S component [Ligaoa zhengdingensis]
MKRKWTVTVVTLAAILTVIVAGVALFHDRKYNIISILIALLSCVPFFLAYEKKQMKTTEMILVAVMVALSSVGRIIFAPIPGFKPVTAITVITALYFGPQAGFLTGSLSAVISNLFFGQGPWTPFQMFGWGIIGLLGGLLQKWLLESNHWRIRLSLFGIFAGVAYSMIMDIWTVLSLDGTWSWTRYWTSIGLALPFTLEYAVSNVIFLMVLTKPIGTKLQRVKKKYGLDESYS